MDYYLFIRTICTHIESHIKEEITYPELERISGFSYRHLRETFQENLGISLSAYILERRIAGAAFEIIHTDRRLTDIGLDYRFENYDTFLRAFKRVTGISPSAFRRERRPVGRRCIVGGFYGPAILDLSKQNTALEEKKMNSEMKKNTGSCILLGVPKVEYRHEECTPFPSCLKACLNYMGQDIGYPLLMAASGAAFRLRWNTAYWDGGNVDIAYIYDRFTEAYERAFQAAGRSFHFLSREEDTTKEDFAAFIRAEIDRGRPVIALGIIGPPEACIITGYEKEGDVLLGWNFFQNQPEYTAGMKFHESGYFISPDWWENKDTCLLMSIGEEVSLPVKDKAILENALDILTKRELGIKDGTVAGADRAYDVWAEWMADDAQFSPDMILPLLHERHMCLWDAMVMVGEGRAYASIYMEAVAERHPRAAEACKEAARAFHKAHQVCSREMEALLKTEGDFDEHAKRLLDPKLRRELSDRILKARGHEADAVEHLRRALDLMEAEA